MDALSLLPLIANKTVAITFTKTINDNKQNASMQPMYQIVM